MDLYLLYLYYLSGADSNVLSLSFQPSNIFFSLDGVIKMGDFGLATALPQEQNDVLYGSENCLYKKHTAQVGTQLYMSPEQVSITMGWAQDLLKVSKGAKIRNRYNQVSHLTQDTNGKVTN